MATCSYNTETSKGWTTLTSNAAYDGCSLDSWLRCTKNTWNACRVDLNTLFIDALKDFSKTSTQRDDCQNFVTEVSCKYLQFHGNLFTNSRACRAIADGKYSDVEKQLVSNCKCNCGKTFNVYCKLGTKSSSSKFADLVQGLNSSECPTTTSTGSSKTGSPSHTTATSEPSSQVVTSQSEAFPVHDASVSKSSASSAATIGGVVGGVVGLALVALLLLILIRRRKTSRRKDKNPDKQPNSEQYTNKAYHHTENMAESVNTHLNTNKQMTSDRQSSFHDYQQLDGNDEHEYAIAGLETGAVTKSDTNNYDVLANVSNYKNEVANDDYDHCKPRKVSECNQEDDYDHFN